MILFAAEISAQQLQRHEPIQLHIACFINGTHPANTKRFDHEKMIERSLHAYFLATRWTGDPRQGLCFCRIDSRPATGACLGGWLTRHWAAIVTFSAYRAKCGTGSPSARMDRPVIAAPLALLLVRA